MTAIPPPDDRLSAYLDNELDAAEHREVVRLLAESEEWRTALAEVAPARNAVRTLPPREAPPGFWEGLLSRTAPPEPAAAPRLGRAPVARVVAVAAAAAAAVAALVVPAREDQERGEREALRAGEDSEDEAADDEGAGDEGEHDRSGDDGDDDDPDGVIEELVDRVLRTFEW